MAVDKTQCHRSGPAAWKVLCGLVMHSKVIGSVVVSSLLLLVTTTTPAMAFDWKLHRGSKTEEAKIEELRARAGKYVARFNIEKASDALEDVASLLTRRGDHRGAAAAHQERARLLANGLKDMLDKDEDVGAKIMRDMYSKGTDDDPRLDAYQPERARYQATIQAKRAAAASLTLAGDPEGAATVLNDAAVLSARVGDDAEAAKSHGERVRLFFKAGRTTEAQAAERLRAAALGRLVRRQDETIGHNPYRTANDATRLEYAESLSLTGDYQGAAEAYGRHITVRETHRNMRKPETEIYVKYARMLARVGKTQDAAKVYDRISAKRLTTGDARGANEARRIKAAVIARAAARPAATTSTATTRGTSRLAPSAPRPMIASVRPAVAR